MPPPSRRSAAARGASTRQPAAKPAPAPAPVEDAVEPGTEALDAVAVDDPGTEALDAAAPAPAARSGRNAAASSRRGAARSGRSGARSDRAATTKSRPVRALTPEEQAARRARLRLILTVLGASAAGILLLVGLFFLLKEDPRARTAREALTTAQSLRSAAD
ncbi:MAG: hypothetical protein RLZZ127_3208, partial [Planctomycetota bacterium]